MSIYADASVLVALFTPDDLTARAEALLESGQHALVVSDLASAEVSSAIARKLRMGKLLAVQADDLLSAFDEWVGVNAERIELHGADVREAERFVRRFALKLRAADAINIAIARRLRLPLATFDEGMASAATEIGLSVVAC